jgi:hypothetical protein
MHSGVGRALPSSVIQHFSKSIERISDLRDKINKESCSTTTDIQTIGATNIEK